MMPKPDIKDGIRKLPTIMREATSQRTEALKELAKASDSKININLKFSSAKTITTDIDLSSGSGATHKNRSLNTSANPTAATVAAPKSHNDHSEILSPLKYKIQFTASEEFKEKLNKAKDLMRHRCQDGNLEKVFGKALDLLLESELKKKAGKTLNPRNMKIKSKNTRSIPAEVKRKVWHRDQGQCQFKSVKGQSCGATGFLQFDHIRSYAKGGTATFDNIQILCANHNRLKAEIEFGPFKFNHKK